ncbi:pilus assembly protein PilP [Myxococcus landrumensis]|uniref:Pilus assembly protein PilP n=1 Tax=Myxococcus landrumensis TaxID=2813577 RepID=A0ABX7N4G6_9BACT|nr:pilus assembly protein PilP [Myxococcus landrumus]QSQ13533.1 pilus assembly protein PilP [Myxococcus landrumus]
MKMFKATMTTAALALTLAACEDAPPPAPPVAAAPAPAPAAPAETAAAVEATAAPAYVYSYNPVGKRDPFRSPLEELNQSGQPNQVTTCTEPLCAFDLDQLKLVAVVTGDANPLAMVEDPQGRGHIVRRNTRVGRQGGKVTQILRDSMTVTEVFSGNGEIIKNPVTLQLKPDDKQDPSYNLMTGKNYGE